MASYDSDQNPNTSDDCCSSPTDNGNDTLLPTSSLSASSPSDWRQDTPELELDQSQNSQSTRSPSYSLASPFHPAWHAELGYDAAIRSPSGNFDTMEIEGAGDTARRTLDNDDMTRLPPSISTVNKILHDIDETDEYPTDQGWDTPPSTQASSSDEQSDQEYSSDNFTLPTGPYSSRKRRASSDLLERPVNVPRTLSWTGESSTTAESFDDQKRLHRNELEVGKDSGGFPDDFLTSVP
ncbi:hypothetical protein C8R46DRAFT_1184221, partial [Mycena filopes]